MLGFVTICSFRNRILLTSTSEVYGDPLIHPQPESYWGNVNPIGKPQMFSSYRGIFLHFSFYSFVNLTWLLLSKGVRSCYDEGKRVAETLMFDYHRQHGIGQFSTSLNSLHHFFFIQ